MPRPYVDATSVFVPASGLKSCSAVTGASGRNPDTPGPGAGPTSAQPAFAVFHTCDVADDRVLNPMIPPYAVLPVASDLSIATEEIACPFGFTVCVTFVINVTPALVVTHTSPPGFPPSGPYPLVTAYTTVELLFVSFGPPAASAFTRLISPPVHTPVPNVSKSLLSCNGALPLVLIRQTRQVPTNISLAFCGSKI